MAFGDWQRFFRPCFTALCIVFVPPLKARPADPKIAARFGDVSDLLRIAKNPQFALNLALILGHEHLLSSATPSLMKMFRE